jgi:hypothetical protein
MNEMWRGLKSSEREQTMGQPNDEKPGYQPGHILSRNSRERFAERTLKDLFYIEKAEERIPPEVHKVTQLVLSMLAIVVIPWERGAFNAGLAGYFKEALNTTLVDFGGPNLHDMRDNYKKKCTTVGRLVKRLRNAVAHGAFIFSNDSLDLEDVSIQFFDENRWTGETWEATIEGVELRDFCLKLAVHIAR